MRKLSLLILIMLSLGGSIALASDDGRKPRNKANDSCDLLSSNDAINQAKAQQDGKVVNVKLERNGANSVYRVRILVDEKRIKNLTIKACR